VTMVGMDGRLCSEIKLIA